VTDLVEFIEARLNEDEQGALNTIDREWRPDGANSCQVYARLPVADRTIAWCRNGHEDDFANALHIARHDPARVLREVEAKRRVLARHHRDERGACVGCGWTGDLDEARTEAGEDCPELLDIAAPFASHSDYRSEWAPA
jgi:Family of unknown function (DUF6221)